MSTAKPYLTVAISAFGASSLQQIASLSHPSMPEVEYVVSWQGSDNHAIPAQLAQRSDFTIVRTSTVGLSHNRNNALKHARGEVILISDDDLAYNRGQLQSLIETFRTSPTLQLATFRYAPYPQAYPTFSFSLRNMPKGYSIASIEMAFRKQIVEGNNPLRFNPLLGIGAQYLTAGEEDLFLYQALAKGYDCRYFPITIVTHCNENSTGQRATPQSNPGAVRAMGAAMTWRRPYLWLLAATKQAWLRSTADKSNFWPWLRLMIEGATYARRHKLIEQQTSTGITPLTTIVIPVYNREHLVANTLRSIALQTYRPLRIVLVDNNSTDNTPAVLNRWKEDNLQSDFDITIVNEPQRGAAHARNRGLAEVKSEYVLFFDSDDQMHPNHMARINATLQKLHPDIAGWDLLAQGPDGHMHKRRFMAHSPYWNSIMHGSMATLRWCARTDLVRQAGGWRLSGWDDIELGVRMLKLNPVITKVTGKNSVDVFYTRESITGPNYSSKAATWERSLQLMEESLQSTRGTRMVNLRRAHLAGLYASEGATDDAIRLYRKTLLHEPNAIHRAAIRLVYHITAKGIRGALSLVRALYPDP